MATTKQTLIKKLTEEINTICQLGFEPTLSVRKLTAVIEDDMEAYCAVLEEELEIKNERIRGLERAGELSTQIVNRLREYLERDQKTLADLQDEHATLVKDFRELKRRSEETAGDLLDTCRQLDAATGMLADSGADRAATDRLISNLEIENRREGARSSTLEAQLRRAQSELAEVKKTLTAEIEINRRYQARYKHAAAAAAEAQDVAHRATVKARAAEEELGTIRCAKWRCEDE